jgi:hypothetical protein
MKDYKPLVDEGATLVAAQGTVFAQKQKQNVAGTPATEYNCNKEYLLIRSATIAVRDGILQYVVPTRKARQRRTLKTTSLS